MLQQDKFHAKALYYELATVQPDVPWKKLFFNNNARPRAKFITWMACHYKLPTKERLHRFGLLDNYRCCCCHETETQNHIFFTCKPFFDTWTSVLGWIGSGHTPQKWDEEVRWILSASKGKGSKADILKCSFTETVYEAWLLRNQYCFGTTSVTKDIGLKIIDVIIYRCWMKPRLRSHIARLMMPM
ncbi:uncharacterized protein LOC131651160 [Vicia villosa]|uniref:uncharacterized protein LOC131651160 n=1 Tax=Vicia villosa TaxID=3911 RepID=UPI00273AF562|nr:uncharacterized protein LOC131651160 [Vicia villosa]